MPRALFALLMVANAACVRAGFGISDQGEWSATGERGTDPNPIDGLNRRDGASFETPAFDLPQSGCGVTASASLVYPGHDMALCGGAAAINQCNAAQLCAAGWSICTASQYLARGGATTPASEFAWLKSCVRDGSATSPPTDDFCSSCALVNGSAAVVVNWTSCSGTTGIGGTALYWGVSTSDVLQRVGTTTSSCAYWVARPPGASDVSTVACCK